MPVVMKRIRFDDKVETVTVDGDDPTQEQMAEAAGEDVLVHALTVGRDQLEMWEGVRGVYLTGATPVMNNPPYNRTSCPLPDDKALAYVRGYERWYGTMGLKPKQQEN